MRWFSKKFIRRLKSPRAIGWKTILGIFGRMLTPLLLNQLHWRLGVSASQLRPVDHIDKRRVPGVHHQRPERQKH